ncbi:hypothetical protein [Gordonia sp. NPDC003376]
MSLITLGMALVASVVSGCATSVTGSGTAPSDQLALYSSEVSVSAASAHRHEATVALCRTATSSMVVMVKGYNDFLEALNRFHSYDKVGDLDDRARAALIAGADRIRDARNPEVPADLTAPVDTFLGSTKRLEDAIGAHELTGLNPIATRWSTDKQAVLDACARYLPPPPGIATRTSAVVPVPTG